jgi:LysM repeat protein
MKIPTDYTPKTTAFRFDQGAAANTDFKKALLQARSTTASPVGAAKPAAATASSQQYTVRPGDNMFSIARRMLESRGADVSDLATTRAATQLSRSNGLANPDMILPGQVINLSAMGNAGRDATSARMDYLAGLAPPVSSKAGAVAQIQPAAKASANPVLEKMLDRAVNLQFIDAAEKDAVRNKIVSISSEYQFKPDDLATVMLMESDGMNPKANNGRCYGVIQFCDGPNRGAASVGYADNPKGILKLGVMDQLDLVKKYFDETGLKKMGPATLDDLYLTVLKPASRAERDPNANLQIPGNQAAVLYPGNDRNLPITRQSLLAGLQQNARGKLAQDSSRGVPPIRVASLSENVGVGALKVRFNDSVSRAYEASAGGDKSDHEL